MAHSDFIRTDPRLGARMVIVTHEQQADVHNAWHVLVAAVNPVQALLYLTEEFMARPAQHVDGVQDVGSSIDLLRFHRIDVPEDRSVTIEVPVRVRVDLGDWCRNYGIDGHINAFADAREHVPACIRGAAKESAERLGWTIVN